MVTRGLLVILGVVVFAFGVVFLVEAEALDPVDYRGSAVFNTEQEYQDFKMYIIESDYQLLDATLLSSDPPLLVAYEVRVPGGETFVYPYADAKKTGHFGWRGVGIPMVMLGAVGTVVGSVSAYGRREKRDEQR